jgi:hypothetical protein
MKHPVTRDGRYFVVRGRLWRMANPALEETERTDLVRGLMAARRQIRDARKGGDLQSEAAARKIVDQVKHALGERGPVWWDDGSPDLNRHLARNTLYAEWYAKIANPRLEADRQPAQIVSAIASTPPAPRRPTKRTAHG